MIMGEIGPVNAGDLMNPRPLLSALEMTQTIVLAWIWDCGHSADSLLTKSCDPATPNDKSNSGWGSLYRNFTAATSKTDLSRATITTGDSIQNVDSDLLVLKGAQQSPALKYAVQSRTYPENPEILFVTTRGAGLVAYNVSNGRQPRHLTGWGANHSVEGQDRVADTLVVVDIGLSGLYVFNLRGPSLRKALTQPTSYLQFSMHGALHCRLYSVQKGQELFALVSIGHHIKTPSSRLAVVNVTNPQQPELVADLETSMECMEGVLVYGAYAYVGGYCNSHSLVVISLANITAPRIVRTISDSSYVNMVGALRKSRGTGATFMYQALWTKPGGLAIFDMVDPASPLEIGRIISANSSYANRVQLHDKFPLAFLPLEGGFAASGAAVIDVSDLQRPTIAQIVRMPGMKVYCLATHGTFVYIFGIKPTDDTTMYIYQLNDTKL